MVLYCVNGVIKSIYNFNDVLQRQLRYLNQICFIVTMFIKVCNNIEACWKGCISIHMCE